MVSPEDEPDTGRRQWLFDTVEIRHIREVPSTDVLEIVDELSHDFATVKTTRWNFIIAAGGPGFLEAAVIMSIFAGYTVAHAFLQELGKDAYQAVRAAIARLYKQRGSLVTPHGGYLPLEIVVQEESAQLRFILDEGLSPEAVDEIMANFGVVLRTSPEQPYS